MSHALPGSAEHGDGRPLENSPDHGVDGGRHEVYGVGKRQRSAEFRAGAREVHLDGLVGAPPEQQQLRRSPVGQGVVERPAHDDDPVIQ